MRRVLAIDDQAYVRATIASVLRPAGYDVVGVDDGATGLRRFETSTFDLAIVDIYMPGLDGVKVIKELRKLNPSFPVIAISGVMLGSSNRTALDIFPIAAGLSDVVCLKKPFRAPELLAAVEKAMSVTA